jgi:hypothetical protein
MAALTGKICSGQCLVGMSTEYSRAKTPNWPQESFLSVLSEEEQLFFEVLLAF